LLKTDLGKNVKIDLKKEKAPETALASSGHFKGKCRVCGKQGHKGSDCWTLDKNKEKLPKNYKKKDDSKTANSTNTELPKLLCNYCKKTDHTEG
jgi:hypothetical protein